MTTHKAILWEKLPDNLIKCILCAHTCRIAPGKFGICGMRQNINGEMITYAYGEIIANNVDPIEKKPLYHFLPGTKTYSIATAGCNFRCSFCQNWSISQISAGDGARIDGLVRPPQTIIKDAVNSNSHSISYTYTEPTVFFEYAMDAAKLAKDSGLRNVFVTNGFMSREALLVIAPFLDAANVDLKAFNDDFYVNSCKARLEPVLDSIKLMKEKNIWVEVTTLLIPGQNDSDDELESIASFLAGVDPNIPWHVSRFHPDYKCTDFAPTPTGRIQRALEIGKNRGLKHVYPGNIAATADTVCPVCGKNLIKRAGFYVKETDSFKPGGECAFCGEKIMGVWA